MISHPNCFSSTQTAGAPSFQLRWLSALLLIVALSSGRARAGELEDCNGAAPEKIEPACTAVIGKARDDLDRAISQKETVESYIARAKIYEAQNNPKKATDDLRRATELTPASVFDVLAQAESKRKIRELSKQLPCGSGQTGTCL